MAITDSCPAPSIINPLQITGFELRIAKLPELSFFIKSANLPSIQLSPMTQPTPFRDIPHIGDKPEYGTLDVRVMVDEKMENYKALFYWINLVSFPEDYTQVQRWKTRWFKDYNDNDNDLPLTSSATLSIKGANGKLVDTLAFKGLVITSLGALELSDEAEDTRYSYVDASFDFQNFDFVEK